MKKLTLTPNIDEKTKTQTLIRSQTESNLITPPKPRQTSLSRNNPPLSDKTPLQTTSSLFESFPFYQYRLKKNQNESQNKLLHNNSYTNLNKFTDIKQTPSPFSIQEPEINKVNHLPPKYNKENFIPLPPPQPHKIITSSIGFEELLLIEEKIINIISSSKNKKHHVIYQCVEWWNCFVVSCLYTGNLNLIKDNNVRILFKYASSLLMYSIILFDYATLMKLNNNNVKIKNNNNDSNTVEEKELYMMLYHHRIFLLMCEYLIYIVASEGNASKNEVEILTKLNKQISSYIKHNNPEKVKFEILAFNELKSYCNILSSLISQIIKVYSFYTPLYNIKHSDLFGLFHNIKDKTLGDINSFFLNQMLRVHRLTPNPNIITNINNNAISPISSSNNSLQQDMHKQQFKGPIVKDVIVHTTSPLPNGAHCDSSNTMTNNNHINNNIINNNTPLINGTNAHSNPIINNINENEIISATTIKIAIPYIRETPFKPFTLVLDLDETLIHFIYSNDCGPDIIKGKIQFRPGLFEFLQNTSPYFELIIFTVATKQYADSVIDIIENEQKYFSYRLYREHASVYQGDFVKDLTNIGRDLSKVIMVDDKPYNFCLQKENGIAIRPYWGTPYENKNDLALLNLIPILLGVIKDKSGDIRKSLKKVRNEIIDKVSSNIFQNHMFS